MLLLGIMAVQATSGMTQKVIKREMIHLGTTKKRTGSGIMAVRTTSMVGSGIQSSNCSAKLGKGCLDTMHSFLISDRSRQGKHERNIQYPCN
jgi:hypothetical protein